MAAQPTPTLMEKISNTLTDAKDTLLGHQPTDRTAPVPPPNPPVEPAAPHTAPFDLKEKLEVAHEKLEAKPMFIPPANPEQQRMMDTLQNMGVRDLGRDFFFFRQFFTEREISLYWKEFSDAQNKADGLVTVGSLTRIGGRRPEFEHVHQALSGHSAEQTLNFSQFLGLLKKQRGREENQTPTDAASDLFKPDLLLTKEVERSGVHSSSDEERYVLTHFVNLLLENDETVQGILPLDYRNGKLGMEFADGGLFCKLINRIRPETINETRFHFGENLHFLQIMDNLVIAIKAAQSIGADTSDVDPKGLIEGDIRQVLAFLEPLFRLVFGHGSHTYQKNEIERLSEPTLYKSKLDLGEGLLGRPAEPGYFVPNLATPALTSAPSESKLTELERGMPSTAAPAATSSLEAQRIRELETELNNRQAQYNSLSTSYNNLLNELNLAKAQQNLSMAEHSQSVQKQRTEDLDRQRYDDMERQRLERERMDRERLDRDRMERQRLDDIERQRYEGERLERERLERERSYAVPSTSVMTTSTTTAVSEPIPAQPTTVSLQPSASPLPKPISRAGHALVKGILRWKRRFIAIDGNHLYIYKNSGVNNARHAILLYGAVITKDDSNKEFSIYVHNDAQKQKAHLAFTSAALMNEWMYDMMLAQQQAQSTEERRAAGVFTSSATGPRKIVASPVSGRRVDQVQGYQTANYGSNFKPVFSVTATDPNKVNNMDQDRTQAPAPTFIK